MYAEGCHINLTPSFYMCCQGVQVEKITNNSSQWCEQNLNLNLSFLFLISFSQDPTGDQNCSSIQCGRSQFAIISS